MVFLVYCLFIKFSLWLKGEVINAFSLMHILCRTEPFSFTLQGSLLLNRTRYNGICYRRNVVGTLRAGPLWVQYLKIPCTKQVEWSPFTCMTIHICKKRFHQITNKKGRVCSQKTVSLLLQLQYPRYCCIWFHQRSNTWLC